MRVVGDSWALALDIEAERWVAVVSERLREHYNETYAEDRGTAGLQLVDWNIRHPSHRFEAALYNLRDRIPSGARVLEVGAGDGSLAESLRLGGAPYSSYTLLELSDVRLDRLRRDLDDERYEFVVGDIENLDSVAPGSIDVLIMVALIEHLIDPLGTMKAIRGLLRPGGFAYVDTPNIAKWTRRVRLLFGRFPATAGSNEGLATFSGGPVSMYDEGHLHYFTYRSLELMLRQNCGYSKVERLGYFDGPRRVPSSIGHPVARRWPAMFGEIAVAAYA